MSKNSVKRPLVPILHVLSGLHTAGIEQLALQLIGHSPEGFSPQLLNTDAAHQELRPAFQALATEPPLAITDWHRCDGPALAWRSFRLCRQQRPAAVLIYPFNRPMLWLALGARLAGVRRLAVAVQNTAPQERRGLASWHRLLRWFQRLGVVPVPCTQAIVRSLQPLPPGLKLAAPIANGCDVAAVAQRAAAVRQGRPIDDVKRVLMVARLEGIKDQATLLRAFAAVAPQRPQWQLQLVGEGPERAALEALAMALGLDPATVFLGRRSDIPELLGQADLFAFSTTAAEGFGIVLIEAMAAGLPVVASDVAACREVLCEGAAGELLPPADVQAWSARLDELMGSAEARDALARRALAAAPGYDIRSTARQWLELLGR
ncbi:glycosyltransferase [Synechococcus sp. ATX 2A4]|uniref:glycosyltransferase n=1 Tax=Synechococcus sp. ATX 2A4 TaxID=2823727 RepID=UPI0028F4346C|nr:glycosyltransferase [Synechococcus sp. ATX 2A4]